MTAILGVGVATLDILNFTETYPGADDEVRASAQQRRRGGNVANTLCVLSQFGHDCRWLGALADDDAAEFVLRDLQANGVTVEMAGRMAGSTPTSYIIVARDTATRSIVHFRELAELSFAQFQRVDLTSVKHCHFEARNVRESVKMLAYLRQHFPDRVISLEIEKPRDNLTLLNGYADIIFYSRHYANAMGYDSATRLLQASAETNPRAHCICTWGEQGCYLRQAHDTRVVHAPAPTVAKVIDSVGAGDTFIAGFLQQYWLDGDCQAAAHIANQLAAKKCAQLGFEGLAL